MLSYPSADDVLNDLGDKVVEAFAIAVRKGREDLTDYRVLRPGWVADHSDRGLANWIHDRIWTHLVTALDSNTEVAFRDSGPTRELYVSNRYRVRIKRHTDDGMVANYPTQTALEFFVQDEALEGMEEIRLLSGYRWDALTREIGPAVLSLRDGQEQIVWMIDLPEPAGEAGGDGTVVSPPPVEPTTPTVEFEVGGSAEEGSAES